MPAAVVSAIEGLHTSGVMQRHIELRE